MAAIEPQPAIFPGYTAPVVRRSADGERELVNMSWGFVLKPADSKAWHRVMNIRDDKVLTFLKQIVDRQPDLPLAVVIGKCRLRDIQSAL